MNTDVRIAPGRYPRGEETKQRIIDVAIEIFGRQGFAGTSTRDIAATAKVNTPALHYYFGSKHGLYNACIDQLSDSVFQRIGPAVAACQASIDQGRPLGEIVVALGEVQNSVMDSFFADYAGQAVRRVLAWEDGNGCGANSGALLRERVGVPIFETFRKAVCHITAEPLDQVEVEMHALSLMGLSMIFHFHQSSVMDLLSWTMEGEGMLARLKVVAHKQLIYALNGLMDVDSSGGCGA